ncbi:MAG TPA: PEP-CTERM sorting domain-containing protein [Chthoniobacteraceae bacterium]|nr:PEP-CTERM sorting domain-containing protein [Chthoniobacteraceae bacterium]
MEKAAAGLTYDLRVNGGKVAYVTNVGQVITLDLYAQVTGATGNGAAEGFQDGFGSVLSSAGGNITGNLASSFVTPFNGTGSQPGMQQTLDGDSDLDLGSNSTVHSTEFFFARATSMQTTGGTAITDGTEFKIASFSFTVQTVGSFADFSPISINFQVPLFSNNLDIEALWQQDGLAMSSNGLNGGVQPTVGAAVMVSVPEPSTLGLLVVAVAGLAARRPRRR